MSQTNKIIQDLKKLGSPQKAIFAQRFFKTGPGQYGEGDIFIGVTVPEVRSIAKKYAAIDLKDLKLLLSSPIHEVRLFALIILVSRYRKSQVTEKESIYSFYLKHRKFINNWDLVDTSSKDILGDYCMNFGNVEVLENLLGSKKHWDRRLAIIATFAFIKSGDTTLTFRFAKKLLDDKEDLMHKATGWMLREAGKVDEKALRQFIKSYGQQMPRTMLRYSIEKFSPEMRKKILMDTKKN